MLADSTILFDGSIPTAHVEQGGPPAPFAREVMQTSLTGEPPLVYHIARIEKLLGLLIRDFHDLKEDISRTFRSLEIYLDRI